MLLYETIEENVAVRGPMSYRVGVDAHVLDGKKQGIQTFIRQLFRAVTKIDDRNEYYFYCSEPERHQGLFPGNNVFFRRLKSRSSIGRLLFEFPLAFRRDRIDVGVFQYISPPLSFRRNIVIVHDILPITHPEYFPLLFRLRFALFTRMTTATASAIGTVSAVTQAEICRIFRSRSSDVQVLQHGPSFPIDDMLSEFDCASILLPSSIVPGQFVLAVGRIEKRKNIDLLVRAFLKADLSDVHLVIVGKQDFGFDWRPPNDPRVMFLDSLEDDQLMSLYRAAGLFVFPSSAEGFGLPLLDAVLFGLPVLSSSLTSMPEVAGSLATYFDPTTANAETELASRIRHHFTGRPISRPTMEARVAHAQWFSWNAGALNFLQMVKAVTHPMASTAE